MLKITALACGILVFAHAPSALSIDRHAALDQTDSAFTGSQGSASVSTRMPPTPFISLRDLRMLAPIQVLSPTESPQTWEILGSRTGEQWTRLGVFRVRDGDFPMPGNEPKHPGDRIPMRFLVGQVVLQSGVDVPYAVVSVAAPGQAPSLPSNSLLFVVHDVETSFDKAVGKAHRLRLEIANIQGVDAGPQDPGEDRLSGDSSPNRIVAPLVGQVCEDACNNAYNTKIANCDSSYTNCVALATAAFGVCELTCPITGLTCAGCAIVYAAALAYCLSENDSCHSSAAADLQACTSACPTKPRVPCEDPEVCSPIVVSLDGPQGFRFTSAAAGVEFDLDADGELNQTAWTQPGFAQAFLALDRNGNGTIDDGTELFGGVTQQLPAEAPNGFLALALLDSPLVGGDGNGVIDSADAAFDALRLWLDSNHDGVSQPEELLTLSEADVESISLDYSIDYRRDPHGNLLRYKSLVRKSDRVVQCVDVLFVQGQGAE